MKNFADRLFAAVRQKGTPVVVGIDPRHELLPDQIRKRYASNLRGQAVAAAVFTQALLDVVAPLVPAVKFQLAFYEALGPEGLSTLLDSTYMAQSRDLIVILDGKRNDIGSTAEAYAAAYLAADSPWPCDALTINPYLGEDGVYPFLDAASKSGKGAFCLVKTSNPSAGQFQDLWIAPGGSSRLISPPARPFYRHVAEHLARWGLPHRGESGYSLLGAVVGATHPEQLAELRAALPGVPFLVPGYGAQGGSARDVAAAFDPDGLGAIVNSSRGLTFAYLRDDLKEQYRADWKGAVEFAVRETIADLAEHTPAGRLRRPG